jgi:pimeloyl-ACP methyl ester carboxylesterase
MTDRESGFADVNGTRLHYETRGAGAAILFVHGFTLDRRMWRRQVDALADRFRVVAVDARGFGRSAMPTAEPYRHCDDLAALCAHLGLARVVAVGHSIGGHQTLELALTRPDLVAGWVGVAASGLAGIPFPPDIVSTFAAIRQAAGESVDEAKRIWSACGWFTSSRESPSLRAELDAMLADYTGWHWTHVNPATNLDPPAAERLDALRVPALVITGDRDLPYNDVVGDALVARVRGAVRLRLTGAGHMANMEEPDAVSGAIAGLAVRCA